MDEQTALSKGMEHKAEEFVKQCGQLYLEKQCEPDTNSCSITFVNSVTVVKGK